MQPRRCILSKFYIKPQLSRLYEFSCRSCILSKFYIKPQPSGVKPFAALGCILSKFYIKPQHPCCRFRFFRVVSYRNSTSNHNFASNASLLDVLYLIEILHQTTTIGNDCWRGRALYLIEILHQTTTAVHAIVIGWSCILSKFYIKPQLGWRFDWSCCCCILSKFYIKPQLARQWLMVPCGCILSKFYIKPQLRRQRSPLSSVVSYRNSTSNHNSR